MRISKAQILAVVLVSLFSVTIASAGDTDQPIFYREAPGGFVPITQKRLDWETRFARAGESSSGNALGQFFVVPTEALGGLTVTALGLAAARTAKITGRGAAVLGVLAIVDASYRAVDVLHGVNPTYSPLISRMTGRTQEIYARQEKFLLETTGQTDATKAWVTGPAR